MLNALRARMLGVEVFFRAFRGCGLGKYEVKNPRLRSHLWRSAALGIADVSVRAAKTGPQPKVIQSGFFIALAAMYWGMLNSRKRPSLSLSS
jgi:hypothetical protein